MFYTHVQTYFTLCYISNKDYVFYLLSVSHNYTIFPIQKCLIILVFYSFIVFIRLYLIHNILNKCFSSTLFS